MEAAEAQPHGSHLIGKHCPPALRVVVVATLSHSSAFKVASKRGIPSQDTAGMGRMGQAGIAGLEEGADSPRVLGGKPIIWSVPEIAVPGAQGRKGGR